MTRGDTQQHSPRPEGRDRPQPGEAPPRPPLLRSAGCAGPGAPPLRRRPLPLAARPAPSPAIGRRAGGGGAKRGGGGAPVSCSRSARRRRRQFGGGEVRRRLPGRGGPAGRLSRFSVSAQEALSPLGAGLSEPGLRSARCRGRMRSWHGTGGCPGTAPARSGSCSEFRGVPDGDKRDGWE